MVRSYGFCPREIHFHSQGIHFLSWEILFNHKSTNLIMGSVPLKKRVLDIYLHARQIADFRGRDKIFRNFAHSKNYKNLRFSKLIHKSKPIKLYPWIDWKKNVYMIYSKTPQSADFGTEQNCTADCEIRRLRVLLYVVNGTEWCITQC